MAHGGGLPRRPGAALDPPPRGSRACRRPRRAPHCGNGFNGSLWAPPGCFAHSHGRLQAALSPLGPPGGAGRRGEPPSAAAPVHRARACAWWGDPQRIPPPEGRFGTCCRRTEKDGVGKGGVRHPAARCGHVGLGPGESRRGRGVRQLLPPRWMGSEFWTQLDATGVRWKSRLQSAHFTRHCCWYHSGTRGVRWLHPEHAPVS